jgi:hypothetical protein
MEWIKCNERMPEEHVYKSPIPSEPGKYPEFTASEMVLAWDGMYGPRVDWTKNGKWYSEITGGYQGQVCHGIVAWMPIPEFKED